MADTANTGQQSAKSPHAEREERILASWKEKGIFEKSLKQSQGRPEFIFYEGPPTANGHPGIHHLEARAFKDAIPRYKTMRGYHVRRKGGWDTHGLPVEIQVEKELGLKSKKEVESYGIQAFNEKCKESVWKYVHEWEDFTNRMGYWVDLKNPYITYKSSYMESLWNIVKTVDNRDLLYKDYKVVPWCPRCGTGLSSHELAQGYQDVKDLAVTVKFKIQDSRFTIQDGNTYLLAWTTTPWTLPGNVGLAVGEKIEYVVVQGEASDRYILAKDRLAAFPDLKDAKVVEAFTGDKLVGLEYEPLFPFLKENISGAEKDKLVNAYKVYAADFVTTTDGTGIVHTAVMYGQDDFELGTRVGLPKYHLVNEDGTFKNETGFLAGKFVKDEATDVAIIKDLAGRGLLFSKGKYEHSYPFCWRCKTPLIYFARDSWYIKMSSLRDELVKENESINWEPSHIKDGRFGGWLREVKDWAISRERYWGTPLPVWICDKCHARKVVGSVAEVTKKSKNTYYVMRHGEAEHNVIGILNSDQGKQYHLTEKGRKEVGDSVAAFKGKIDLIYVSPLIRTQETAQVAAQALGLTAASVVTDNRLHEMTMGELEGKSSDELSSLSSSREDLFTKSIRGVETRIAIKKRIGAFLEDVERTQQQKNILIIGHDGPLWMLEGAARGLDIQGCLNLKPKGSYYLQNGEIKKIEYSIVPHNAEYELDLHRPYIDAVKLTCDCGGEMSRVKEVMDVWFDSGAMPFAQDHYPFEKGSEFQPKSGLLKKAHGYPADFISEAIDQTRGWFYTLHAIGVLMGVGKAYKNVVCLGHILDAEGKKMSKSVGNIVDPWVMMNKYGADALRFWMYSVNQPGDSKNFDEKTVDEVVKKVFNLAANVVSFYKMYGEKLESRKSIKSVKSKDGVQNVLDRWIVARLNQTTETVTKGLESYKFFEPARAIRDFVADLSQWYLRRSRDRFKGEGEDKEMALGITRDVLVNLAKIMAPFTPFFADYLYKEVGGELESVHLEEWPEAGEVDGDLIAAMETVRSVCSKGLEARTRSKINVRQPLAKLSVKKGVADSLTDELIELVKDEVNVKNIVLGAMIESDVELDINISPELKEEGMVRELMRLIQDLRKAKGLSVNDQVVLSVETDGNGRKIIDSNDKQLKAACGISEVRYSSVEGEAVDVGGVLFKVKV